MAVDVWAAWFSRDKETDGCSLVVNCVALVESYH
jgi:hypothetical protein